MTNGATRGGKWLRWVLIIGLAVGGCFGAAWVALMFVGGSGLVPRSGEARVEAEGRGLIAALESYWADNGAYPPGGEAGICRALSGQGDGEKVYFEWTRAVDKVDGRFLDPWGTPYRMIFDGDDIRIHSAGKDRKFETGASGDDVVVGSL